LGLHPGPKQLGSNQTRLDHHLAEGDVLLLRVDPVRVKIDLLVGRLVVGWISGKSEWIPQIRRRRLDLERRSAHDVHFEPLHRTRHPDLRPRLALAAHESDVGDLLRRHELPALMLDLDLDVGAGGLKRANKPALQRPVEHSNHDYSRRRHRPQPRLWARLRESVVRHPFSNDRLPRNFMEAA
jgi:hypothetical protein